MKLIMRILTKVDKEGRIAIPKEVMSRTSIEPEGYVDLKVEGGKLVVEPVKSVADTYYGFVRSDEWPEDLDDIMVKAVKKFWSERTDM